MSREPITKAGQVTLRVSADESRRWKAAALADGRTLSNWLRRQVDAAAFLAAHKRKAAAA